jgi:small conductance mechanosensitive channel
MNPRPIQADAGSFLEGLTVWAIQVLPNLVAATLILLIGFWLSGWVARQVGHLFDDLEQVDATLRGVLTSLVRYSILVIVFVAALGQLGVQTTSILAALGAAGLAIGLALQGTLANVAAGVMLLWLRPFRVGDYIDAGGVAGTVKEVRLFASEMHTWDGVYQFVPNSELWNKRVINYSRLPTRLVQVKYGVAYGDDIGKGKSVLLALAKSDERVISDLEPQIFVSMLGDNAVELSLRVWAARDDYWSTLRDLNEKGKSALEGAGLTIPFPQIDVHHHGLNALPDPREH